MSSKISAGTTSSTALNMSADTTGNLEFQTNGTTTAMTITNQQLVGVGTTTPIRQFSISYPTTSAEMAMTMAAGQANNRTWNLLVNGGNSTTPNNFVTRLLDDSGVGKNTGFSVNGSTGILRTGVDTEYRGISPGSVPAGTVIKTTFNEIAATTYSATTFTLQDTGIGISYTPLYNTSKLLHLICIGAQFVCDGQLKVARNGTVISNSLQDSFRYDYSGSYIYDLPVYTVCYQDSPATTSAITYRLYACATGCGGTVFVGSTDAVITWTVLEIAA